VNITRKRAMREMPKLPEDCIQNSGSSENSNPYYVLKGIPHTRTNLTGAIST
jgi:hypothetical protein